MKKVNRDLNLQLHQQARNGSVQSEDPLAIARHLVTVLNAQGHSTQSYSGDLQSVNIYVHGGINGQLVLDNMAQNWRLEEPDRRYMKSEPREDGMPF